MQKERAKVVDDILEKMTDSINTLPEDEKQQDRKDWIQFKEKMEKMNSKAKKTIKSLRAAADKLDQAWWDYKVAQASGTTAAIVGGVLTIGGGIATVMTAGAATPLLIAGTTFGVAGSTVNVRASFIDAAVNSAEIKKAEKLLGETIESINEVNKIIHDSLVMKETARLFYIYGLVTTLKLASPNALKLLRGLILYSVGIPSNMVGVGETVAAVAQAAWKSGAKAVTQGGAQGAGKAGAQAADDVVQAAGQYGAKATTKEAGKAGAQVADDVVQAGAKAGSKFAGKVIIGVNAAFLMLDAIDLGFTIRDLVQNKGSDAAKILRDKADELEDALK